MTDSAGYESSASNQSNLSSATADRGTFYAVYLYTNNSSKSSQTAGSDASTRADNSNGSLSLLATDLGAVSETDLRCYLLKKVARDLEDSRGNLDVVELSLGDKVSTPMACFHQAFWKETSASEKKDHHAYLLCFVSADDGTLDLFFSDVENFGKALVPSLADAESEFQQALRESMENWYHICVAYIGRCVEALGENLAVLLHFALNDSNIDIEISSGDGKSDFRRFVDVCKLDVLNSESMASSDETATVLDTERPNLTVEEKDGKVSLSRSESSDFCRRWARALLRDDTNNPLVLRRIIEGLKIKTIQDMNLVKRLVRLAENDHYALYNAYKFLKECGYSETLLRRAVREGSVAATREGREVVALLSEHLLAKNRSACHVER